MNDGSGMLIRVSCVVVCFKCLRMMIFFFLCSVKLVEQELWQKEEKGLIGILPVRDETEEISVGSMLSSG